MVDMTKPTHELNGWQYAPQQVVGLDQEEWRLVAKLTDRTQWRPMDGSPHFPDYYSAYNYLSRTIAVS